MWGLGLFLSLENCCLKFQNAYDFENFPSFSLKKICYPGRGGGGGGYSNIFIHTYVGSGHFWGAKKRISIFFGVFRKINIFWGLKILWIFFSGHHKIRLDLGVISLHLRIFPLSQGTESGIFFGVAKISNIILGCLKFLIFLGVKGRCWARAYV